MVTNFHCWLAEKPRPGNVDGAPDWAIEAVRALEPVKKADKISDQLRIAIASKHISFALAQRAADAMAVITPCNSR